MGGAPLRRYSRGDVRRYEAQKTGFQPEKTFKAPLGSIIAGRYEVRDFLGTAAFSSAYSCFDHETETEVCLKVRVLWPRHVTCQRTSPRVTSAVDRW